MSPQLESLKQVVHTVQPDFKKLAEIHGAVNWEREAAFAMQILNDSDYLQSMARGNPDSLKRAIINVAAVGLTLNPVLKLAYLVPRDKKVSLDISYQGYIHLATDVGAIKWAIAEIVREKDKFTHHGIGREPTHSFEPFGDRGKITGCYCLAKTHDEEFIVTLMPIAEVYSIRDRSQSWKSGKNSPWKSDETEMIKKTVIKRAYKSWPKVDSRLDQAVSVANDSDPVDFGPVIEAEDTGRINGLGDIRKQLVELNRSEEKFVEHLVRTNKRDIKGLEDLTTIEVEQANAFLSQLPRKAALSENAG